VHWRGSPLPRALLPPLSITPGDRLDAEVAIACRAVPPELRRAALYVETVVSRADGDVALQQAAVVLFMDQEPIAAAAFDPVSADDVHEAVPKFRSYSCDIAYAVSRAG
jgi:hypothetical protein